MLFKSLRSHRTDDSLTTSVKGACLVINENPRHKHPGLVCARNSQTTRARQSESDHDVSQTKERFTQIEDIYISKRKRARDCIYNQSPRQQSSFPKQLQPPLWYTTPLSKIQSSGAHEAPTTGMCLMLPKMILSFLTAPRFFG